MKRLLFSLLTVAVLIPSYAFGATVAINQFVEHPALNESVIGFKEGVAQEGVEVTYQEHNAQANMATVLQIVNQIAGEKPDLILAVATPSAQATAQKIKNIPILFTACTDPVTAGLVESMEKPGANVTGTSDMNPIQQQVALIREIHPNAKTIGTVYNAGEANSVVQVKMLKAEAEKQGFTIVEASTVNTAGVYQAAKTLVGKVDAIYLPTDNTVIANMEAVLKVCKENKIGLYPGEADSVIRGAVASAAISYRELGRQTGIMAAKILKGEAQPATMPVETLKKISLVINPKAAKEMGVTFPESLISRADKVVD